MKHIKLFEDFKNLNEGRSIEKIQYDWTKLTTTMQATAANWKAAEGKAKDMLLGKLKDMTAKKKQLEAELDVAITDKDKELELVVSESILEKLTVDIVAKKWDELYGEDFKEDYNDIWKSLKAKGNFTLADLEKAWNKSYGEAFKHEYSGLYKELMNESQSALFAFSLPGGSEGTELVISKTKDGDGFIVSEVNNRKESVFISWKQFEDLKKRLTK
jgi:hypothetical protein